MLESISALDIIFSILLNVLLPNKAILLQLLFFPLFSNAAILGHLGTSEKNTLNFSVRECSRKCNPKCNQVILSFCIFIYCFYTENFVTLRKEKKTYM